MNKRARNEPDFISRQVTRCRRFYFGRPFDAARAEVTVAGGGWELVAKDYVISRDAFPWLSIEFVAGGVGRLHMAGKEHGLRRGVVFAYGQRIAHRIETEAGEPLSKYYLNFSGREAADLMAAAGMGPGTCRALENTEEIEEAFEALIDEGAADRPRAQAIVALQLRILLLKMAGAEEEGAAAGGRARQTLDRCLEHIDRCFLETRTVEELAEACHVSVGHLTRSFVRFGYGSPYRYLTRRKMLHAAGLLDAGRLLVREVADRLGMDAFQFSRVFKRVHGISPSDFVRRHGTGSVDRAGNG